MPRNVLRVKKRPSNSTVHQGNLNQLLDRVSSPTMNSNIRLLRGANRNDGYLSSLFPKKKRPLNLQSQYLNSSPSQHPKSYLDHQSPTSSNNQEWCTNSPDLPESNSVMHSSKRQKQDEEAVFRELMEEINFEVTQHVQSQKTDTVPKIESKRKWNDNITRYETLWANSHQELFEACIAFQAVNVSFCYHCEKQVFLVIRCNTCNCHYCEDCDSKFHFNHPFHIRLLLNGLDTLPLKPTEFFVCGKKETLKVPVPLFIPVQCAHCKSFNQLERRAGDNPIKVVTQEGRFDLYSAVFTCRLCEKPEDADIQNCIISGFWPGFPSSECSYLFSTGVLNFWQRLKNNTPGTSLMKYVETLKSISKLHGRNDTINENLFNLSSRHYEHYVRFYETTILKRKHDICYSCGSDPLACHCDGNRKVYRYEIDSQVSNTEPLLQQLVHIFPDDKEVALFVQKVDTVYPRKEKDKENCGNAVYKAGRADSYKVKNQDETGLLMSSCRHGVIFKALDMHEGENYRLVLWMLQMSHKLGYKIFCYDVICNFVRFLKNLVVKAPEFQYLLDEVTPFLSRMHGKTHEWVCQLEHSGHWKKNAGLTTGEMQEQSNAYMSRLGNVTKHMGKSSRRDHLISAILDWNKRKEENMAHSLCKSLLSARKLENKYRQEFQSLLGSRIESDMERMADDLLTEGKSYKGSRQLNKMPQSVLEDELEGIQWHIKVLQERIKNGKDGSKSRNLIRHKVTILKARGKKVIDILNSQQNEYVVEEETIKSGKFPWQLLQKNASFYQRYQLVDTWMLLNRSKEEITQVKKEMKEYLKFLVAIRTELKQDVDKYLNGYHPFPTQENPLIDCSKENLLRRGKATAAAQEISVLSSKILDSISYFKHFLDSPLEELKDAMEEDDDDALEALWHEIEEEIAALNAKDEEVIHVE